MQKHEFRERWESDEAGGGITFEDIAKCAVEWRIARYPKTMRMDVITYRVLKAAETSDAEDFRPETEL